MKQKFTSLIILLFILTIIGNAQEKTYLMNPRGEMVPLSKVKNYKIMHHKDNLKRNIFGDVLVESMQGDTLTFRSYFAPGSNFNLNLFANDVIAQWFPPAPADMKILAAGFMCSSNDNSAEVELKLVEGALSYGQIDSNGYSKYYGFYEADNEPNGATPYLDDPERTGPWVSGEGLESPFGNDIWSFDGVGYSFIPVPDPDLNNYNWVEMNLISEPIVPRNSMLFVSVKNTSPGPVGIYSSYSPVQNYDFPPAFKWYPEGRDDPPNDKGWWSREFTYDFVLVINLVGDIPPDIHFVTELTSTISTEPQSIYANITDGNPSGGDSGVAVVNLVWSTDGGMIWTDQEMTGSEPDFYGMLPGFEPGTEVMYKAIAMDVNGLVSSSLLYSYFIVDPPDAENLVIFNGFNSDEGFPQDYYFGESLSPGGESNWDHDVWSYGTIPMVVLEHYTNVFEICTNGPDEYFDEQIRNWLSEDSNRNYFLAGDEWLGARYNFEDMDFNEGDFEYDILGITHSYNDVSYDGSSGQNIPSLLFAQEGTIFGDPIKTAFDATGADSLMYNPIFEINEPNWIDGFDFVNDANTEVDMKVKTRGIDGNPDVDTIACQIHRVLPLGNKIIFLSYDPLSLNTAVNSDFNYYEWIGWLEENTPFQSLNWFGIPTEVESITDTKIPDDFELQQNYPNPFNPSTKIRFSIPENNGSQVTLKIFDVLGNEITVLVNKKKSPGTYEVNFDAGKISSGVYFYQLKTDNFIDTKKMILLK